MHLNKISFRFILWALIVLPNMCLFACGDGVQNTSSNDVLLPTIDNPQDAQAWLEKQAQRAQHGDTVNNSPAKIADRRLLRIVDVTPNTVFISMNSETTDAFKNQGVEGDQNAQGKGKNLGEEHYSLNGRGISTTHVELPVRTTLELSQADLSQIRFSGVIQNQHELFGLVQVGERVYRVKQHELIGVGKWRVVSIDEARMQLNVNGKIVTYDK